MTQGSSANTDSQQAPWACVLPALIPYAAIGAGLMVLRNAWAVAAIYYGGVVACLLIKGPGKSVKSLARGFSWLGIAISTLMALAIFIAIVLGWPLAVREGFDLQTTLARLGLGGTALVAFVAGALLINPPMEELLWRSILRTGSARGGLLDLAFAGFHVPVLRLVIEWPYVMVAVAGLALFSWLMRWSVRRFEGLATAWIAHLAADAAIVGALIARCGFG